MGQAPCNSSQGQYSQGGCGGSIPLRHCLAGSEPARQRMKRASRGETVSVEGVFVSPLIETLARFQTGLI